jgi:hypothetical protein
MNQQEWLANNEAFVTAAVKWLQLHMEQAARDVAGQPVNPSFAPVLTSDPPPLEPSGDPTPVVMPLPMPTEPRPSKRSSWRRRFFGSFFGAEEAVESIAEPEPESAGRASREPGNETGSTIAAVTADSVPQPMPAGSSIVESSIRGRRHGCRGVSAFFGRRGPAP